MEEEDVGANLTIRTLAMVSCNSHNVPLSWTVCLCILIISISWFNIQQDFRCNRVKAAMGERHICFYFPQPLDGTKSHRSTFLNLYIRDVLGSKYKNDWNFYWMHVTFNWKWILIWTKSFWGCLAHFFILVYSAGTNSEMSNASETEEIGERESRPKGVGGDDRGSKRGGRGRGSSTGRGRGGPGPRNTNTISSGMNWL